ncbi:MAG: TadE/TadG family type IV pilus assembly protein [Aquabacterium sp.]
MPPRLKTPVRRQERGAAALEFGLLFLLFFSVMYAIVGYSLMFMVKHGLTQGASEAARAAVRLDPMKFNSAFNYEQAVSALAKDAATQAIAWLPEKAKTAVGRDNVTTSWVDGQRVVQTGGTPLTIKTRTLTVTVKYPNYATNPLIKSLNIPPFGPVPSMPTDLVGTSSIQLQY